MALEIQGKLHEIFETQQITEKFRKREFVVEIDDNGYTQYVKFQLNQDKCNIIDNYAVNEQIKVNFNLSGRPYTRKTGERDYITNIVAWKIDKIGSGISPEERMEESKNFELSQSGQDEDVLPF